MDGMVQKTRLVWVRGCKRAGEHRQECRRNIKHWVDRRGSLGLGHGWPSPGPEIA